MKHIIRVGDYATGSRLLNDLVAQLFNLGQEVIEVRVSFVLCRFGNDYQATVWSRRVKK